MRNVSFSDLCGWFAIALSMFVFCGWQFDVILLRSLMPGFPQTTPLTAIMILALGVALLQAGMVIKQHINASVLAWSVAILSGAVAMIAVYTLTQYFFDLGPGIETFFYHTLVSETGGSYPGRPSPQTVLTSLFISGATGLSILPGAGSRRTSMVLALTSLMVVWLVLFGYASTTNPFFSLSYNPETGISPLTTVGFLVLTVGVVSLRPEEGLARLVTAPSSGGKAVRSLVPVVIVVPIMLGWLVIYGRQRDLFDTPLGFALNWGVSSLFFAALVIWLGFVLDKRDAEKEKVALDRERMLRDLRQATRTIKQQAEDLKRSNLELQQFAYIASHDLQAPLRGISGFVQLLKEDYKGKLDERADDWMARILQSTLQMQTLIQDLLTYSRVDSESNPVQKASMNDIFHEATALLRDSIVTQDAKVTRGDLPVLMCERARLSQLLQNLIGNALKYRGKETPEIHVSAARDGNKWVFAVRDNGIGIESKYSDKIFEIFRRLHTEKEYPGTGIGLAVCRRIVHRHRGEIWLHSEPGQGSTFYFSIPEEKNSRG